MQLIKIEQNKTIYGLSVRTSNANEMNADNAKLGQLWQRFDREVDVDYQSGERVYGVYSRYESDAMGEFDVLAGSEKCVPQLETIVIPSGRYLMFSGRALANTETARVEAVIACWGAVWTYFSHENSEYKRAYQVDYEHYENEQDIKVYISVL